MKEVFAANLRKLRGNRTQAELAELANIPFRTYQNLEGGTYWPEYKNVRAIAAALGVPETRLFKDPDLEASPEEALEVLRKRLSLK